MTMNQIYDIVNNITSETLGGSVVVQEDLSNIVDIGREFENASSLDNFVRKLIDHIGKVVFVNRPYTGRAPSVLMDGWEFGSILEKIRGDLPEAVENESWMLQDGASYDPNIFTQPKVDVKFFNDRTTFEIPQSVTERQVRSAFSSAAQMNGLISMLNTDVNNSMTVKTDSLIMRTINAAIGETLYAEFPGGVYSGDSGVRAVNLLYLYNQQLPVGASSLTAGGAMHDADFIRFASLTIKKYIRRMQDMSRLFNIGGTARFTPADMMHVVMLADFKEAADVYLYDGLNQFNTENIRLPGNMETVSFWQGSGTAYDVSDTSAINIKTPSGHNVSASYVIGTIFDRDTLGVANIDRRVTSNYNGKAEFWNYWHKFDAGYFLDLNENFVVFYLA